MPEKWMALLLAHIKTVLVAMGYCNSLSRAVYEYNDLAKAYIDFG